MAAQKIKTLGNGTPYVPAGGWAMCFTWLIDFVVVLVAAAAGVVALAGLAENRNLSEGLLGLIAVVWVFAAPLAYGLFYGNGRVLGARCTGTRLVRLSDGGRIGAKGPWAMLVRTILMPVLLGCIVLSGGYADGTMKRTSIDIARTRQLHADGYSRQY